MTPRRRLVDFVLNDQQSCENTPAGSKNMKRPNPARLIATSRETLAVSCRLIPKRPGLEEHACGMPLDERRHFRAEAGAEKHKPHAMPSCETILIILQTLYGVHRGRGWEAVSCCTKAGYQKGARVIVKR
jgi:hypothetical protein